MKRFKVSTLHAAAAAMAISGALTLAPAPAHAAMINGQTCAGEVVWLDKANNVGKCRTANGGVEQGTVVAKTIPHPSPVLPGPIVRTPPAQAAQ
jgi:hypothetical protein